MAAGIDRLGRRAQARGTADHFDKNWPIPTHTFCYRAIFNPNTPCNVWFFWISRHMSLMLAKKNQNIFGQTNLCLARVSKRCVLRCRAVTCATTLYVTTGSTPSTLPTGGAKDQLPPLRREAWYTTIRAQSTSFAESPASATTLASAYLLANP